MSYKETVIRSPDRTELFVRDYPSQAHDAADGDERTLLIVHGMSEHSARYDHVARRFLEFGWRIVVADQRGHGRSGGVRTHVKRFRNYIYDIELIRNHFKLQPDRTVLLGHSMGGLVAIRYAQRFPGHTSALVLMSPLLGLTVPIPLKMLAAGKILSFIRPVYRFRSRVDPTATTRNQAALTERENDPFNHRSVTAGWFFEMKAALRKAWREAATIRVPVLILQAGQDRVVDPSAPARWLEGVAATDKSCHLLTEHYHELFNEPEWEQTTQMVADWLDERILPVSSPQDHCLA